MWPRCMTLRRRSPHPTPRRGYFAARPSSPCHHVDERSPRRDLRPGLSIQSNTLRRGGRRGFGSPRQRLRPRRRRLVGRQDRAIGGAKRIRIRPDRDQRGAFNPWPLWRLQQSGHVRENGRTPPRRGWAVQESPAVRRGIRGHPACLCWVFLLAVTRLACGVGGERKTGRASLPGAPGCLVRDCEASSTLRE